ncbi:MAG: hypothetical protein WA859_02630, partial [Candidatus Sulfotelmatobacter sp.]
TSYDETKTFAHALAQLLEHDHPDVVVSDMKKQIRAGKVFVDWSQNDEHKTTVAVYSLRARERPTVSTPVTWQEVEQASKKKDAGILVFEAAQTIKRVEKFGDLFAPLLTVKQRLPNLKKFMQSAASQAEEPISIAAQAEKAPIRKRSVGSSRAVKKSSRTPQVRAARRKV